MRQVDPPDLAELLKRAEDLRPLLERNADTTDALRRLPDEVVTAVREAGLCRLMVPRRFGGYQTTIHTYLEVIAELGRGCGSTAWVASLINVCAWLAALFPDRAQRDVWGANPDAWVAGSLAPHGTPWRSTAGGASRGAGCGRRGACTRNGPPAAST